MDESISNLWAVGLVSFNFIQYSQTLEFDATLSLNILTDIGSDEPDARWPGCFSIDSLDVSDPVLPHASHNLTGLV